MKGFNRFLIFLLILIVFVAGVIVGYARRGDIARLINDHQFIAKVVEPIEKIGSSRNSAQPASRDSSSSTASTSSGSSSGQTASGVSSSSTYKGEIIQVKRNGKTYRIRKDFKESMDAYEAIFDDYIDLLKNTNVTSPQYMAKYTEFMDKYQEFGEHMEKVEDELTDDEENYYLVVTLQIEQKLLSISM